jgi:flagellin
MSVINTNVKALYTQAAMKVSGREGATAMQQLSTGKRINSAKDDAAGMAIADRMTQQIRSLNQAVRNAGDAISLIQTAEGATGEITDMLQRMRELAIQAINDTNSGDQRGYLDLEFQQLKQEIVRISDTTEWNGFPLLNGTGGVAQGEQPVYKVQSTPQVQTSATFTQSSSVVTEPIEQQLLTFTAAPSQIKKIDFTNGTNPDAAVSADGNFTITTASSDTTNSVTVSVALTQAAHNTAAKIAAASVSALNNDATFVAKGRQAIDNGDGSISIVYAAADGDGTGPTYGVVAPFAWTPPPGAATTQSTGTGNITVGGVTVAIVAGDSSVDIAGKVKVALDASTFVTNNAGRLVKDNGDGTVSITYNSTDADIADTSYSAAATGVGMTVRTQTVSSTPVTFANNGGFLKSGKLSLAVDATQTEVQKIVFGPSKATAAITVGGVSVGTIADNDTAEEVALKVQAALNASTAFGVNSGRTVTNNLDGSLTISYAAVDGDVSLISFADTGSTGITASRFTTTNYAGLSASYDVDDGNTVTLNGKVDAANGQIIFSQTDIAQVDTITLVPESAGAFVATTTQVKLDVNGQTLTYAFADTAAGTVKEKLVAEINANKNISQIVTAELQRDGTITLTANQPGIAFSAHATIVRADGDEATVSSVTTTENATAGANSTIISGDMTVSLKDQNGLDIDFTNRAPVVSMSVGRGYPGLPILSAGDLIINDVTIGPSFAEDDTLSNSNNAGGAIAKAAAINRQKDLTGVQAVVSEAVLTGTAMVAGASVTGTLTINGYTSPVITTILNNTRETRANVVEAINRMTARTGVVAVDSGDDAGGIRLEAADGRNIEVFFNTDSDNAVFAARTGLREGLTTGSIALESKVEAPVVLSSSGNVANAGFISGDFSENRTVVATRDRAIASPATSQISSVTISQTVTTGDKFTVTLNGRSKEVTSTNGTIKEINDLLIDAINTDSAMSGAVTATKGSTPSEIYFTSKNPGIEFTLTASTTSTTGYVDAATVVANADATNVKLNTGDLVINGVAIPGARSDSDIRSPQGILSGQRDSSALATAAAINSVSEKTGVTAEVKPASMVGTTTVTGAPGVFPETGIQSLYINGVEVEVLLTEDEPADTRRNNVVAAINRKLDSHGVQATNNGNGVTLTAADGRNVSVWFDSAVPGLAPSSFGLSAGDEIAQSSKIKVNVAGAQNATASVNINGIVVTTAPFSQGTPTTSDVAAALKTAIEARVNSGALTNLAVSIFNDEVTITSTIPGSGFTILGADSTDATLSMKITTPTANSFGTSPVTGIWNGSVASTGALTMYSGVELISENEFTVSVGTNGYKDPTHWKDLGFTEGTFGGRSSIEMSPPRIGRMTFQVGATMNQSIHIDFADFGKDGIITGEVTGDVALWDSEARVNRIDNREAAQTVLMKLDTVLDKVNGTRATMGAVMNRLEHVIDNLMNVSMNSEASRSQIEDADYAAASTELARTQIMQQAATSVLAQANADQQNVLKLLQ